MAAIRHQDTTPERLLRSRLDGRVFRYQPKRIPGRPDFANRRRGLAVFADGCFWHKCPSCFRAPKSRKSYWIPKIERNRKRDDQVTRDLEADGWTVLRFWECEIKSKPDSVAEKIRAEAGYGR